GKFQESLQIAELEYQEYRDKNKPIFLVDSLVLKWSLFFVLGKGPELWEDLVSTEKVFKSVIQDSPLEVNLRKGFIFFMKGYFFYWEKKYDEAIELHKKTLEIFEEYVLGLLMVPFVLNVLGLCYSAKGELELALEANKKSLTLSKRGSVIILLINGSNNHSIGDIYFQKGDIDQAIDYYEKSLNIHEKISNWVAMVWTGINYDGLIRASLYNESHEEAVNYLNQFYQYMEKNKISKDFHWYRLSKARTLRSSSRVRDRAEAEKILKELIEGHKLFKNQLAHGIPDELSEVIIELCDFYLEELRLTNDLKIIEDIKPLIKRLLNESVRTNSYILQVKTYLLYSKISLLLLNMGDARRYLSQAQQVADDHGLQLLAREISTEHDKLLEQLDKWEEFNKSNAPISDRMELASLDESLDLIQRKRAIKPPESTNEEPVLLLIMALGGILLFSYPFSDEIKINDELFGGFLSAFTSISDEVLSEGLDRAKFGQYTVLMENIADFSFCYLFKGQTYLAKKKLANFTENFQKNTSMMQTLDKFNQSAQVMELKNFPFLEGFIKRIFIDN
ncbi:MAG: tetratricopeptide repeat protein, partial [Candidatus Thorarchaeota archaeon]